MKTVVQLTLMALVCATRIRTVGECPFHRNSAHRG